MAKGNLNRKPWMAQVWDSLTGYYIKPNANGSINVNTSVPTPPGKTKVNAGETAPVTKGGGTETYAYTIPNGQTFTLQSFEFGGFIPADANDPMNARARLYYRPNGAGNTSGQVLISTIYLQHISMFRIDFSEETYVGDGTRVLEIDVLNYTKVNSEFDYRIRGYY